MTMVLIFRASLMLVCCVLCIDLLDFLYASFPWKIFINVLYTLICRVHVDAVVILLTAVNIAHSC